MLFEIGVMVFFTLGLAFLPAVIMLFSELRKRGELIEEMDDFLYEMVEENIEYKMEKEWRERLFREIWR